MSVAALVVHYIEERDHRLMRRCNRWQAPRWVRLGSVYATRCGDGWLWYALAIALMTLGDEARFRTVGSATLAAAIGVFLFLRLKKYAGRRRPCALEAHCWAELGGVVNCGFADPARHAFPERCGGWVDSWGAAWLRQLRAHYGLRNSRQRTSAATESSVMGNPARVYSQKVICCASLARAATMALAPAPGSVRLPLRVADMDNASHALRAFGSCWMKRLNGMTESTLETGSTAAPRRSLGPGFCSK